MYLGIRSFGPFAYPLIELIPRQNYRTRKRGDITIFCWYHWGVAFRIDRGTLKPPVRRADGSMVVEGVLTRSGVFEYANPDGTLRREYRPPSEVFNDESIKTFALTPVTNDHPGELVTAENVRDHIVGVVGNDVRADGQNLVAQLAIFDARAVADIEAGKQELSCGYEVDLEETPGITPDGERYDAIQRKILGNHVAIVEKGRAGPIARIRMDAAHMVCGDVPTPTPIVEKKTMDLEQALKRIDELQLEKAKEQLRADQAEADLKAAKDANAVVTAERDDARDKLEASDKARTDAADARNDEINAAVKLRLDASGILPDEDGKGLSRFDGMTDREIRCAVIEKVTGKAVPADKCDVYVSARFDAATESFEASSEALEESRAVGKVAKIDGIEDRESKARADMIARHKAAAQGDLN